MSGDGTGETTARIEVGGKGHGTTGHQSFRVHEHRVPSKQRLSAEEGSPQLPLSAMARMSASEACSRWSAETAESSAASPAPLMGTISSAWVSRQVPFPWLPAKATGLLDGENALLTEDIAELCQIIMNHYGHHFADNVVHVFVRLSRCILPACAREKWNNVYTLVLVIIKATHLLKLQGSVSLVQTVAALSLYGSHSHSTHLLQKPSALLRSWMKLHARVAFTVLDASSTFHDGHITLSFKRQENSSARSPPNTKCV